MAHIFPYFLPLLCQLIRDEVDFLNYTRIGVISMVSIMVTIPFTIILGVIGDKIRKWRLELIAIGFVIIVGSIFIIYVANSYGVLILAAVISGIGASVFHPIALPLLSQEFGADRNIAHGYNLIFGTLGAIITPILTIGLSEWIGWRKTTLVLGIAGVIMIPALITPLLLTKKYLTYDPPKKDVVIEEQVIETPKKGRNGKSRVNGLKNKSILKFITWPFIALMLAIIVRSGIFRIINTFTSFIFEDRFGATPFNSALIMSLVIGSGGIAAFISGNVSKKIGSLKTMLLSTIATVVAAIAVVIFVGAIDITGTAVSTWLLIIAIILFVIVAASFYFANPSANSIQAEVIPLEILSSVYGVVVAVMTSFSAIIPVIFGAIVDGGFSLPYEYLMPIVLSVIPLLLLIFVKSKIGFKTPDEIENERAEKEAALNESLDKQSA